MPDDQNTWANHSRLVLVQLEQNTYAIKELGESVHRLRGDFNTMLGDIHLKTVRELAQLEQRVGGEARGEVAAIREHFDEEIKQVQLYIDSKIGGVSNGFEKRIDAMNLTMTKFVEGVNAQLSQLQQAVAGLQIKAGVWGAGGSLLGLIVMWGGGKLLKVL